MGRKDVNGGVGGTGGNGGNGQDGGNGGNSGYALASNVSNPKISGKAYPVTRLSHALYLQILHIPCPLLFPILT